MKNKMKTLKEKIIEILKEKVYYPERFADKILKEFLKIVGKDKTRCDCWDIEGRSYKERKRKQLLKEIIKIRPFVDLTRDLTERNKIEKYLNEWEQEIRNKLK